MKVLFSAKMDHDVIKGVIKKLKEFKEMEWVFHDPLKDFFIMEDIPKLLEGIDFIIVKAGSECSIDLLHFAKQYEIPTLHDVDIVLTCKNKIALDCALRMILTKHSKKLKNFSMPEAWNQSVLHAEKFKEWARDKLPLVIKSHYQHDKYMRFNFLVNKIEEVDLFCKRYENFLYYDVYIQKFIECDGIDRKIYVIGDKIFGIKRENPIYMFLRDNPDDIDVDIIKRETFEVSDEIKNLASIISKELGLKIFGFDLIKPLNQDKYYLIDLNDFPGFRGINNIENVLAEYLLQFII